MGKPRLFFVANAMKSYNRQIFRFRVKNSAHGFILSQRRNTEISAAQKQAESTTRLFNFPAQAKPVLK
jgi:hypothetical protein